MTRGQYIKQIEDVLLAQRKRVSSSKEEARKVIDSLGIRHLLVPIKGKKSTSSPKAVARKGAAKRAAK